MTRRRKNMFSSNESPFDGVTRWLGRFVVFMGLLTAAMMLMGTARGATSTATAQVRPGTLVGQLELLGPTDPVMRPNESQTLDFELRLNRALAQAVSVQWVLEPAYSFDDPRPAAVPASLVTEPLPQGSLTIPAFTTRQRFTVTVARAGERGDLPLQLRLRRLQGPAVLTRHFHSLKLQDAREHLSPAAAAQAARAKEQFPVFEQLLAYLGAQRRLTELMAEGSSPPSPAAQLQLRSLDQLTAQIRKAMLEAELGQRAPLSEAELKRLTETLMATLGPKP